MFFINKNKINDNEIIQNEQKLKYFFYEFNNVKINFESSDDKNIFNLIEEFIFFYKNINSKIAQLLYSKKITENKKKILFNQYIKINLLYNEIYNYAHLMLNEEYINSYEKQKNFIYNKPFINIVKSQFDENVCNQIFAYSKIKAILTILCIKNTQDISKQTIENDLNVWLNELENLSNNNKLVIENKKMLIFIKSLYYFFTDKNKSEELINELYKLEYPKYKENIHTLSPQYTGLGKKPYITMPIPDEFKSFFREKILENQIENKQILNHNDVNIIINKIIKEKIKPE